MNANKDHSSKMRKGCDKEDNDTPLQDSCCSDSGFGMNIYVGPSSSNSKKVIVPYFNMMISPIPQNYMDKDWPDHFQVQVDGKELRVTRIDKNKGWGMPLLLRGYFSLQSLLDFNPYFQHSLIEGHTLTINLGSEQSVISNGKLIFAAPEVQAKSIRQIVNSSKSSEQALLKKGMQSVCSSLKKITVDRTKVMTKYTFDSSKEDQRGKVILSSHFGPGSSITHLALGEYGNKLICRRGSYFASSLDVSVMDSDFFDKLQPVIGHGDLFVRARGSLEKIEIPAEDVAEFEGESIIVMTQEIKMISVEKGDIYTIKKRVVKGPGFVWVLKPMEEELKFEPVISS